MISIRSLSLQVLNSTHDNGHSPDLGSHNYRCYRHCWLSLSTYPLGRKALKSRMRLGCPWNRGCMRLTTASTPKLKSTQTKNDEPVKSRTNPTVGSWSKLAIATHIPSLKQCMTAWNSRFFTGSLANSRFTASTNRIESSMGSSTGV